MFLTSLALAAPMPCGTPYFLPTFEPRTYAVRPPSPGPKTERDASGEYPHSLQSDNFVVKWGTSGGVTTDEVEMLIAAFEDGWAVEIGEMGHPAPEGTESYLFNVYIGDTGGGTPSSYGAGGYYNRDEDDMPMIVIARNSLYYTEYVEGAAVHELYHALQDRTSSYSYTGDSAWYWEATAEWATGEVYPDNPSYAQFLYGYAYLPYLAVNFFDYPDTGALQEYHQYGAFIFPRFLTEQVLDRQLVVDSWVDPGDTNDPLEALATDIEAAGLSFEEVFAEFAAHNAVWDYQDGDLYFEVLDETEGWYDDAWYPDWVSSGGTDGWVDADEDSLPGAWSYSMVGIIPGGGETAIAFEGDLEGTDGTDADWRVYVVRDFRDGPEYVPLTLTDGAGSVTLEDTSDDVDIWLVVVSVAGDVRDDETFPWRYSVTVEEEESILPDPWDDDEELEVACGCSGFRGSAAPWILGVLALTRRRAPPRAPAPARSTRDGGSGQRPTSA